MSENLDHLAVVSNENGKFQGAYYHNKPTPSGCVRFILTATTSKEFDTEEEAASEIERLFPHMDKINPANP